jgi:hypothetical protein
LQVIDIASALWGGLVVLLGFLLSWIAKHVLDRIFLPRFMDWWAKTNRTTALRAAELRLREYKTDLKIVSDSKHLIMYFIKGLFKGIALAAFFLFIFITFLFVSLFWPKEFPPIFIVLTFGAASFILTIITGIIIEYEFERYNRLIDNEIECYGDVVKRLRKLLEAAHLDPEQRSEWLKQVPEPRRFDDISK